MNVGDGGMVMTARRGRPAKPTGEGTPVRIEPTIVRMAKMVGVATGESAGEVLSRIVAGPLRAEHRRVVAREYEGTMAAEPPRVAAPEVVPGKAQKRITPEIRAEVWELHGQGLSQKAIAAKVGIAAGSVNKIIRAGRGGDA